MCVCMNVWMYVCPILWYISLSMLNVESTSCMYVCMHVCIYVCTYVCMYLFISVCMYVCIYVCMYEWTASSIYYLLRNKYLEWGVGSTRAGRIGPAECCASPTTVGRKSHSTNSCARSWTRCWRYLRHEIEHRKSSCTYEYMHVCMENIIQGNIKIKIRYDEYSYACMCILKWMYNVCMYV